jgi:hypothetical protein
MKLMAAIGQTIPGGADAVELVGDESREEVGDDHAHGGAEEEPAAAEPAVRKKDMATWRGAADGLHHGDFAALLGDHGGHGVGDESGGGDEREMAPI